MKCKVCGSEVNKAYNGVCTTCFSVEAVKEELKAMDADNELPDVAINQPLGDRFLEAFSARQTIANQKNGIPSDKQLKVKLHCTDMDWETVKPIVDRAIAKYRAKLESGEYEIMEMNQFGLDGVRRVLIENDNGVAIAKLDKYEE